MMPLTYLKAQDITPEQKQRIEAFTPEHYIEWSKIISNEERQFIVIVGLELKIDSLKTLTKKTINNFESYIKVSDSINSSIMDKTVEIEKLSEEKIAILEKNLFKAKLEKWYVLAVTILSFILFK